VTTRTHPLLSKGTPALQSILSYQGHLGIAPASSFFLSDAVFHSSFSASLDHRHFLNSIRICLYRPALRVFAPTSASPPTEYSMEMFEIHSLAHYFSPGFVPAGPSFFQGRSAPPFFFLFFLFLPSVFPLADRSRPLRKHSFSHRPPVPSGTPQPRGWLQSIGPSSIQGFPPTGHRLVLPTSAHLRTP